MSFVAIGGLICLLFVALSARRGVNIEEKCTKQYDLNFKLIGYNCEWSSARLFYYVGEDIVKITFKKLSKTSKVYIDGHVDLVAISEGDIDQCEQIISPAGIKILVNDEECGSHEMVMTSTTMTIAPIRVTKMESTPYSDLEPTETSTVQITPTKVMVHDTEITETRMLWIYTSLVAVFELFGYISMTVFVIYLGFTEGLRRFQRRFQHIVEIVNENIELHVPALDVQNVRNQQNKRNEQIQNTPLRRSRRKTTTPKRYGYED